MTDDLSAFIRARLDDDEQTALATHEVSHRWHIDRSGYGIDRGYHEPVVPEIVPEDAVHILRHDPARVLAQCAALSDMLTELEQITERSSDPDARMHAQAAIGRMSLIWQTVDELDASWRKARQ